MYIFVFGASRPSFLQPQPQPALASRRPDKKDNRTWRRRVRAARLEAEECVRSIPQPQPAPVSLNPGKKDVIAWSQRAEAAQLEAKESIQHSRA